MHFQASDRCSQVHKRNSVVKPKFVDKNNDLVQNTKECTIIKDKCCVKGCRSLKERPDNLMYHNFPGDGETVTMTTKTGDTVTCNQLKLWLCVLEVRENQFKPWTKVCSLHFTEDCYEQSDQYAEKKLKSTAIPSRNLPGMKPEITECPKNPVSYPDVTFLDHTYCRSTEREELDLFCCSDDLNLYKCKKCEFQTELLAVLKAHFRTVHQHIRYLYKLVEYSCGYCKFRSHSQFVYTRHLARHGRKHRCKICTFSSLYLSDLLAHVKEHGAIEERRLKQNTWYRCARCFYASSIKWVMRSHNLRMHSGNSKNKWFKCKRCPYKSRWILHVRKHSAKRHKYLKFKCSRCDQAIKGVVWKESNTSRWWACTRCCKRIEISKSYR